MTDLALGAVGLVLLGAFLLTVAAIGAVLDWAWRVGQKWRHARAVIQLTVDEHADQVIEIVKEGQ